MSDPFFPVTAEHLEEWCAMAATALTEIDSYAPELDDPHALARILNDLRDITTHAQRTYTTVDTHLVDLFRHHHLVALDVPGLGYVTLHRPHPATGWTIRLPTPPGEPP